MRHPHVVGSAHPWELTEAGEADLGVLAGGRRVATVRTGHGLWADHIIAQHLVRTQPRHTVAELDALAELVDLLDHWDNHGLSCARELLAVVLTFAARYRDHPDHPERRRT
ncbi:DUF6221 family protein [Streptomyces telluris]|uniref:Uncharacterized protein n=1 Tax=Streptomyces telluris TaxID=2720021 RepID=A0A9X2LLG8_9ACTN|nr:hypothetical protein [Streptomyces telluris]MCQ8773094.1 hypothetical protein [Streptomyces telluris]NJP81846.1 hypothetical protein [Streptomyces telluris]